MRERGQRLGWSAEGRAVKADAEVTLCLSDSPASFLGGWNDGGGGGEVRKKNNNKPCASLCRCRLSSQRVRDSA